MSTSPRPTVMPDYDRSWQDLIYGGMWQWGCRGLPECVVWLGQTLNDTLRNGVQFSGTSVVAPMPVSRIVFSSRVVGFIWAYTACRAPGSDIPASTRITAPSGAYAFVDEIPTCPELKRISNTGTLTLDSTFSIGVEVISPWMGPVRGAGQLFFGDPLLELSPLDPPGTLSSTASAAPTRPVSTRSLSLQSTTSSTSGSTSSTVTTAISTLNVTFATNDPLASLSFASSTASTSTVGVTPIGRAGSGQGSRVGIIVGAVSGVCVCAAVILICLVWWRRCRTHFAVQPYEVNEKVETSSAESGHAPYVIQAYQPFVPGGGIFQSSKNQRLIASSTEHIPALLGTGRLMDSDHSPIDTSENGRHPDEESIVPQSLPMPQGSLSPPETAGPLPAYETYMDAPLVTFRRAGTRRQQGAEIHEAEEVENREVDDVLRKWAEERRDLIPLHLERRLRSGGYDPAINPGEILEQMWLERFGVTRYELVALRDAYGR